jgi:hypothetical protein
MQCPRRDSNPRYRRERSGEGSIPRGSSARIRGFTRIWEQSVTENVGAARAVSAIARRDLGGDLTRAQETILEAAAQAWVILSSLDDYIARQPSLVTKKRRVVDVVVQRMQIAEGLAKNLERLGLERKAMPIATIREQAGLDG